MIVKPARAAIVQNFEITVDGYYTQPGTPPSPMQPPIGTKGYGSFTLDESQIKYNDVQTLYRQYPPLGYYVLTPSSFSLDFLNHRYTEVRQFGPTPSFATQFSLVPTGGGQYRVTNFGINTLDKTSELNAINGRFYYRDTTAPYYESNAYGSVQLTSAEEVPEPSEVLGIPIAIAFCWLFQRKWASTKAANRK